MQNNFIRLLGNCSVNLPANYNDFPTVSDMRKITAVALARVLSVVGLGCMDDGCVTEYPLDGTV